MRDKFMSGWGMADGKINRLVIECNSLEDAERIERNAKNRPDMRDVFIQSKRPNYPAKKYVVSHKHYDDMGEIWKK